MTMTMRTDRRKIAGLGDYLTTNISPTERVHEESESSSQRNAASRKSPWPPHRHFPFSVRIPRSRRLSSRAGEDAERLGHRVARFRQASSPKTRRWMRGSLRTSSPDGDARNNHVQRGRRENAEALDRAYQVVPGRVADIAGRTHAGHASMPFPALYPCP